MSRQEEDEKIIVVLRRVLKEHSFLDGGECVSGYSLSIKEVMLLLSERGEFRITSNRYGIIRGVLRE